MTPNEALALRWASQHLHLLQCPDCGGRWIAPKSTAVLAHRCSPPRSGYDWRPPRQRVDEEREAWARRLFGPAFEDAVDPDQLLRRVEEDR